MYLYPEMNLRLLPYLQSLADGIQVVSYQWVMPGVESDKIETIETGVKMMPVGTIHYFRTPLLVDPDWKPKERTPVAKDFEKIKDQLKFAKKKTDSGNNTLSSENQGQAKDQ